MRTAEELCRLAGVSWREAPDAGSLADLLAGQVADCLRDRIKTNGQASLVVSGGSTPAPVFKRLAGMDIEWQAVSVTLADERWVPVENKDSNEQLLRNTLLVDKASAARFIPLYRTGLQAEPAAQVSGEAVAAMVQPFTVVILGMGSDGHTASLFPDAPAEELQPAMDLENQAYTAILNPPSVPQQRITLTRSALLRSDNRFLHITGAQKKNVLGAALAESCEQGSNDSPPGLYTYGMKPIVGLLTDKPKAATVYWSE